MRYDYDFNINDYVRVRLTLAGRAVWQRQVGEIDWRGCTPPTLQVYQDGYTRFQMWELMQTFGPALYMGMPEALFEQNNLVFEVRA